MSKLGSLGFDITKPIKYSNAENTSVIVSYSGHEYNIDQQATPIQWAALESDLEDGFIEIGGYIPPLEEPPEVILLKAKESASIRIANYTKRMRLAIAGISDETAMASWPVKLSIAQAVVAGTASPLQVAAFQAEIDKRGVDGETVALFTAKVLRKAGAFTYAAGLIDGLDTKVRNLVAAAQTPEAVETALTQVKAEAETEYVKLTS